MIAAWKNRQRRLGLIPLLFSVWTGTGMLSRAAGAGLQQEPVSSSLAAAPVQAAGPATGLLPESQEELLLLAIGKRSLSAELRTLTPPGMVDREIARFRVALGRQQGDKQAQGDLRTPEGIYLLQAHIEIAGQKLPRGKYGDIAVPLNFPNPMDRLEGKTGYGIWLHGAGDDRRMAEARVTEGCVAFYNAEIRELKRWLSPDSAFVMIAPELGELNDAADTLAVAAATRAWLKAWQERALDSYISHYGEDFRHSGRGKRAYQNYKRRVFAAYRQMEVGVANLRVLTHPKYAVALFNQDFRGDSHYRSQGRKILYWRKEAGDWRIVREEFHSRAFTPLRFARSEASALKELSSQRSKL